MSNKRLSRALSLVLLCALLFQLGGAALAAEEPDTIYLTDEATLYAFAEHCAYDAWSEGKTVILQHDIALGGVDFSPIASFGGIFEGGGHTISGLNVSASVSPAGLFGTIAESGVVRELNVEGSVTPDGSAELAGGIVGVNRGTLVDCSFTGTVNGERRVGGIAGENAATGTIRRCGVNGGVFGKNMTGGVVGANHGTASLCVNRAYVNTDTIDPSVSFDKFDLNMAKGLDSLTSPDTYNITVDSGGIAGFSDGALLGCRNYGGVGYQHVGYNVGGVAGRSSGHIASCANEGVIYGRREVGGVVGMAEPYIKLDLKESSVDRVRRELNALSALIDKAANDAQSGSEAVSARLTEVGRNVDAATDSARTLTTRLGDYWDGTVTEIDRGSEIVDTVIPQLRDISGELADASGTFGAGLGKLEAALGDLDRSGAAGELSAMARDLSAAADDFDAGTKQISAGLAKLNGAVGPADGVSEEDWREGIYGENGALKKIRNGTADAFAGMSGVTSVLNGLLEKIESGDITTPEQVLSYLSASDIGDAVDEADKGFQQISDGVTTIKNTAKIDDQAVKDGFDAIENGADILANGRDGTTSPFHSISSGLDHLSRAVTAGESATGDAEAAIRAFRDASNEMSGALSKAQKTLDYLSNQKKLNFETLGEETDAAADALYGSMRDISNNLELLNRETKASADTVLDDVRQINSQFTVLMNTLLDVVEEAEGASVSTVVRDTSDEDIESVMNGKVLLCGNAGEVVGDIDVGGVAGAMMVYNELDPENDGEDANASAFRKRYELKCILQDCANNGPVTGKRDNVGAVCGSATLGVISGCEAYGSARSEGGDCVGGIAGYADNTIRKCWSRCSLAGGKNIGGVVGSGKAERASLSVMDCRSLVEVTESTQYAGAVIGADTGTLSGNLFVSDTLAGIDRVSERGRAEPVSYEQMLAQEGLPREFRRFTLRFVADDVTVRNVDFNYGDSFDASVFPEIPAVEGKYARWDRAELDNLRFDTTVTAIYENCITAIGSDITRSAARPTFFVEGAFSDGDTMEASPAIFDFDDGQHDFWSRIRSYRRTLLEQWQLALPDDGAPAHTVRYLPPEGVADHLVLYARKNGAWTRLDTGKMGSYLTFEAPAGETSLTVVSTATPWWVWALVGGFLLAAAALLAALLIRKKPRRALTDEEKAKEAARKKRRKTVRIVLVAAALALGGAVYGVLMLAPGLTDSMGLYMLLHNYAERTDVDMELSLKAHVNGKAFDTGVGFFTTEYEQKRVSCVMWQDIPLYYCDGAMLLENGKAYRAEGVLPDYSRLLSHVAGLYRAVDVTKSESNGTKTYHAAAQGAAAEQVLKALLPDMLPAVPETESVQFDLVLVDGEPDRIHISWNGEGGDAEGELRLADQKREHTLPQEVRTAISSGEYASAEEITPALKRLLMTWTELATRDPLGADVTLSANCGPLLLDEKMAWQRTVWNGTELSCVSHRGTRIYYTDGAACRGNGTPVNKLGGSFTDTAELLHLAYEAFLLGDAACTEITNGWRYSVSLDAPAMEALAGTIAPETKNLGISMEEGSVRLDITDTAASAVSVQCKGSLRVVGTDVPASVSARLDFEKDAEFSAPSQKVLSALGLGGK